MMSARFPALLLHDTRLQLRYGIYYAYGIVILMYAGILISLGRYLPDWVPAFIIFTDPAVLGFFFLGALMMLEKSENVRTALGVTPVSTAEYFWAKTLPLTALAIVAVSIIALLAHEVSNLPMLIAITALTSVHYLGFGAPVALHFRSVTSYLIGAGGIFIPIVGPGYIALYTDMPAWAMLIPSAAQMRLMLIATGARSGTPIEISAMFAVSAIAAILTFWYATNRLQQELGRK